MPELIESASMDENGVIYSTVVNVCLDKAKEIKCQIADSEVKSVRAEIITGKMDAHNTFENKDVVKTEEFTSFELTQDGFIATIPACSVVKFICYQLFTTKHIGEYDRWKEIVNAKGVCFLKAEIKTTMKRLLHI